MIQFYSFNDLSHVPVKKKVVDDLVKKLQQTYGESKCFCHPQYQWAVGFDMTPHNFQTSIVITDAVKPCDFIKKILTKEIDPFLQEEFLRLAVKSS